MAKMLLRSRWGNNSTKNLVLELLRSLNLLRLSFCLFGR